MIGVERVSAIDEAIEFGFREGFIDQLGIIDFVFTESFYCRRVVHDGRCEEDHEFPLYVALDGAPERYAEIRDIA